MTDNSVKLRMLITLQALYKYTDKNHRMNSVRLNEFLRPFGMESGYRVISDTVKVLQEFGIKVAKNSNKTNHNVWIEDRPLPDPILMKLIFALRTNPYITQEQTDEILESIRPILTVYQEPLLQTEYVDLSSLSNKDYYQICSVLLEAIQSEKRVIITTEKESSITFSPFILNWKNGALCAQGYDHKMKTVKTIMILDIQHIKIERKNSKSIRDKIQKLKTDSIGISSLHNN